VKSAKGTVQTVGERGLIERAKRLLGPAGRGVEVGIGDDAAVLKLPALAGDERLLLASDMFAEGTHFKKALAPAWIGWKALAANVSDIGAMGGLPVAAVVSLGVPSRTSLKVTDGIAGGLARCARRFSVAVVGGDTVRSSCLVIDVAVLGRVNRRHLTLRVGLRAGDRLYVTGSLGGAVRTGRHARFVPRLAQAQWLIRRFPVSAMMDLSDGLSLDAWQMARASGKRLRLIAEQIPKASGVRGLSAALHEGEDFELLFGLSPKAAKRLPGQVAGVPVTWIGDVVGRGIGVELSRRGRIEKLKAQGFSHW